MAHFEDAFSFPRPYTKVDDTSDLPTLQCRRSYILLVSTLHLFLYGFLAAGS